MHTLSYIFYPGNKMMQNKEYINLKRGLNSAVKPCTQYNYNITFKINSEIIAVDIHWNYLFFTILYTLITETWDV